MNEVNNFHIPAPADMVRRLNNVVREAGECALVAGHLARRLSLIGFVQYSCVLASAFEKHGIKCFFFCRTFTVVAIIAGMATFGFLFFCSTFS